MGLRDVREEKEALEARLREQESKRAALETECSTLRDSMSYTTIEFWFVPATSSRPSPENRTEKIPIRPSQPASAASRSRKFSV